MPAKKEGAVPHIKKAKDYFNEVEFQKMLFEYQRTTVVRDGVSIIKNEVLEEKLVKEITKIVNAIIIVYRYYIFEEYEDLLQHALQACFTNFLKFTPSKGTAFNYFSIISKISLLNYTDRRKRHRNHQDIEDQVHLEGNYNVNYDMIFSNLETTLFGIIDENYVGTRRKKYIKILSLIIDYLNKTKKFISKSDLYGWCRSYGIKNVEVREFVNEMKNFNADIFGIL
jgi:hypothetical protein